MSSKLSITCLDFKLRDELRAEISAAAEKLFHLELYVSSGRLTLGSDGSQQSKITYKASLVLKLRSSEIIARGQADLPMTAVKSVIDQAEHLLLERLRLHSQVKTELAR